MAFYRIFERPPALPGIELLTGALSRGAVGGGYFAHYAIATGDGPIRCHYRGQVYDLSGRYVILVAEGDFIATTVRDVVTFKTWHITPELMRQASEERGQSGQPRFARTIVTDTSLFRLVRRAWELTHAKTGVLEQQEALAGLLDAILGGYADSQRARYAVVAHRGVRRMLDLIHDGYDRELRLDMLAERAGLNKFYALRAFKRVTGVTPHEYQRRVRIGHAYGMLRAGHSVAQVAHTLGFCDQSHFTRTFRQIVLTTPRQYKLLE